MSRSQPSASPAAPKSLTALDRAIDALEPVTLSLQDYGSAVANLQTVLNLMGAYHSRIDGCYGARTEAAVQSLQEYFGLPTTGVFDSQLWHALSFWTIACFRCGAQIR